MRSFLSGTPLAGRYVLVDELAVGPDATVWRGLDDVLGRPVAVKLFTSAVHDDEARAWIHLRARMAARLAHPHAAAVFDFGDAPAPDGSQVPYVVQELLDGVPLTQRLADGPLPWPRSTRMAAEIAGALAAAHARGVVHGEVTPDTVLVTPAGAKLIGFAGPSRAPLVEFTPPDDVRGLGVVLGSALLGGQPHAGTDRAAYGAVDGLPDDVRDACLACLALRPEDRPTVEEVRATLTTVVTRFAAATGTGEEHLLVPPPSRKPAHAAGPPRHRLPLPAWYRRRWPEPSRVQLAFGAAVLVGVVAFSGVVATGVSSDLLAAAVGRTVDRQSPDTANAPRITSVRPGGGPAAPAPAGSTPTPFGSPSPSAPVTSPSPTADPSTPPASELPTPDPTDTPTTDPATTSPAVVAALTDLRTTVDNGRTAGEITPEAAADLDNAIDELARAFSADKVVTLHWMIDFGGGILPARIEMLHVAVEAYAAAVTAG